MLELDSHVAAPAVGRTCDDVGTKVIKVVRPIGGAELRCPRNRYMRPKSHTGTRVVRHW
jgi:crotonobetainyl-CoA:carnitine CoA-transferase CaiB-like acyl-CoA transferase